jgi:hypothetical protein
MRKVTDMAFTLEFKTDNAAFLNDEGDFIPGPEIARVLSAIASKFDEDMGYTINGPAVPVRDYNGNRIGSYRLTSL